MLANGNRTRSYFSLMDRVDSTRSKGPSVTAPGVAGEASRVHTDSAVIVTTSYDALGRVTAIGRRFLSDPRGTAGWANLVNYNTYDDANRVTQTNSPEAGTTLFYKDLAGNDTAITTPRGHVIRQKFDALGRVMQRSSPQVTVAQSTPWADIAFNVPYFTFPTVDGTPGLCIAGDTAYYRYDAVGNMQAAENGWARVSRSYSPAGAVKSETQQVRTSETSAPLSCGGGDRRGGAFATFDFQAHQYTLSYAYDLEGRRKSVTHPSQVQVCGSGTCQTTYGYNSTLGTLDTVTGPLSVASRFSYDVDGRLTTLTHPNGQNTSYSYDISGQLLSRSTPAGTSVTYTRDAFGRILTTAFASPAPTGSGTTSTLYGPHGPVVYQLSSANATVAEEFITDAVGSRLWARAWTPPGAQGNLNSFKAT